jgi:cell wall-associated NlpC family hydrolase
MFLVAAAAALTIVPSAHAATRGDWNAAQQRQVAKAGVLPRLGDGRFHGERALTGAQLAGALTALGGTPPTAGLSSASVSVAGFDARIVAGLGLSDTARHVQATARAAGLHPPRRFGTEVVARFMGLRTNHPAEDDALELYPTDAITRAEAAQSFATLLQTGDWADDWARAQLSTFALPSYDAATRRALRVAVSKIGMPYVWGGETDGVSTAFGYQAHGGYDCSGFVWRVFKLSGQPAGARIGGRTAAQMAGEIRKSQRIHLEDVRAGDLIFFGSARFRGRATERSVDHVGIALSPDWMIHSSSQGVYVSALADRSDRFTWARRVL